MRKKLKESDTSSSDLDDYQRNQPKNDPKNSHKKKNYSNTQSSSQDELFPFRYRKYDTKKPRPLKSTRALSVSITNIDKWLESYHLSDAVDDEFVENTKPDGTPCRFFEFSEVKDKIFHPETFLDPNETGFNTRIPDFSPNGRPSISYFIEDSNVVKFDITEISKLTNESLLEQLEWVENEIDKLPVDTNNVYTTVIGFDEKTKGSLSIQVDVNEFDWEKLGQSAQFDVILMDPPWPITLNQGFGSSPLEYQTMQLDDIANMNIPAIQKDGYCFMWVVMSLFTEAVKIMTNWGYEIDGLGNWVKMSVIGKILPATGTYVSHAKETIIIGRKGKQPPICNLEMFQDLIFSLRNARQSHKPDELYRIIERMFPNCLYLELFARNQNLRDGWVSLGLQVK